MKFIEKIKNFLGIKNNEELEPLYCCFNGGNKHKFVPRYTERHVNQMFPSALYRSFNFYNEYVYDICIWCGKIIMKPIMKNETKKGNENECSRN